MTLLLTFALLTAGVLVGLLIARATLTLLFTLLGLNGHFLIRWHLVAFGTMLFWCWYFAPTLSAM
jgi:hypothetical protein